MKNHLIKALVALGLASAVLPMRAADTDLFAMAGSGGAEAANVLFILDNAAHFSANVADLRCSITAAGVVDTSGNGTAPTALDKTAAGVEQCALYSAISSLSTSTVALNIGIMVFNSTGQKDYNPVTNGFSSNCSGGDGGCLIVPVVPLNATNKQRILEYIRLWETGSNYRIKGNNAANGATMQEAWAYFSGKTGLSGRNYAGISPSSPCGKNNIIFVGNAYRNNATPGDATGNAGPKNALFNLNSVAAKNASPLATAEERASITGTIRTPICPSTASTLQTAENKGAYALNWARYMRSQGWLIYSIGILGPTCNAEYAAHLTRMGDKDVGGGKYFGTTNYTELVTALNTALSEILSVNSVFASVSLPLNANVQGQYLNQVYVGMFRPDIDFNPSWPGNMKQYKLGFVGSNRTELRLLDADGNSAINSATGFVGACARSFWSSTPSGTDTYWSGTLKGDCSGYMYADSPDGNIVERGAAANMLRQTAPAARKVLTCASPGSFDCGSLAAFSTSTAAITQAMLNPTAGATDRNELINWARGLNVANEMGKGETVMRPYVHGDVVHSRPVAVNYATDKVAVFYGGNDGMLRAINGNRSASFVGAAGTYAAGSEIWSFMPPEFFGTIHRLRKNDLSVSFPNSPAGSLPKPYGMDGPITAFQGAISGTPKAYVYATMRRGGRIIYAFDVTTPDTPSVLWKKGCPNIGNDTGCSSGFEGIGQTWSMLKPMYAAGYESGNTPLLIMGGGYDSCEDFDSLVAGGANHACATTKGNKIYVIKAATGEVVKAFSTARSVIADATLVADANGKVAYAYSTDMGGNVYRLSFAGAPSDWEITKIASLGCDTAATTCIANRKFAMQPSVVTTDGVTYYVMLGSGEREKPVDYYRAAKAVGNHFFMVMDQPSDSAAWLSGAADACGGQNVICKGALLNVTGIASPTADQMAGKKGWYLALSASEQVVTSAVTVFGVTSFSTHQPAVYGAATCTPNLGETRLYKRDYLTGKNVNGTNNDYQDVSGDGLPPSPVAGQVVLDDGTVVPFCIGCSNESPLEGTLPKAAGAVIQPKNRLYWYLQK